MNKPTLVDLIFLLFAIALCGLVWLANYEAHKWAGL